MCSCHQNIKAAGAHLGPPQIMERGWMERPMYNGPIYKKWGQSHASNLLIHGHKFNNFILKKTNLTLDPTVQPPVHLMGANTGAGVLCVRTV